MIVNITKAQLDSELQRFMQEILLKYTDTAIMSNPSDAVVLVCSRLNVSRESLLSKTRHRTITGARHVCAYVLKEKYGWLNLHEIGDNVGISHHTTVMYALKKVNDKIRKSDKLKSLVADVFNEIDKKRNT